MQKNKYKLVNGKLLKQPQQHQHLRCIETFHTSYEVVLRQQFNFIVRVQCS